MRELLRFRKVLQEEKYEEYKMNFEGMYHGNGLLDSAQIWNRKCHPKRICTEKLVCFCSGSVELQMWESWHFFLHVLL